MKLPIETYGNQVLRQKCVDVSLNDINLKVLIENMWETMDSANGCGLAAPQVGKAIRLFIVNTKSTYDILQPDDRKGYFEKGDEGILETFINAKIIQSSEEEWEDNEGCLSIPSVSKEVKRPWNITLEYFDSNLKKHTRTFGGYTARVIQHEYDHTQGILYVDRINPLARKLLEGKLKKIAKGQVPTTYLMK